MKRIVLSVALGAGLACGLPALAQKTPDIGHVSIWKVKAGSTPAAFAEARKKHNEFHRAQKDTHGLQVWEIINGDHAGNFVVGSFDHYWKDFDGREAFDAADAADAAKTINLHGEVVTDGYWTRMADMSRMAPGATAPPKYAQVTHYWVSPADAPQFEDALKEITAALTKANWPSYSTWYRLVSGGDGPHYVLSTARNSMAEFAPPEKGLLDTVSEQVGSREANELFETTRKATKKVYTEILAFRPDLSYIPPPAK